MRNLIRTLLSELPCRITEKRTGSSMYRFMKLKIIGSNRVIKQTFQHKKQLFFITVQSPKTHSATSFGIGFSNPLRPCISAVKYFIPIGFISYSNRYLPTGRQVYPKPTHKSLAWILAITSWLKMKFSLVVTAKAEGQKVARRNHLQKDAWNGQS